MNSLTKVLDVAELPKLSISHDLRLLNGSDYVMMLPEDSFRFSILLEYVSG